MNKKLICLLMFVFSLGLAFTACSDDDDDDKKDDYAKEIAATYDGKLTIAEIPVPEMDNSIILSRVAENKVSLVLNEISIILQEGADPVTVKNIKVNNVPVTKSNETYSLTKTTEKIKFDMMGEEEEADVTVEGTVKAGKADLKITVGAVEGFADGLNITFAGNKK